MKADLTIINFGDTGNEPFVIRDLAEAYGATVLLLNVGKASDLLSSLREADAEYIVLSIHGDEKGFCVPELGADVTVNEKYTDHLAVDDLESDLRLAGGVVVSTACKSGSKDFGEIFLRKGAKAYVAPDGYPEGNAIPFFVSHLFYNILGKGQPLSSAFKMAQQQDSETKLFRFYS